MARINKFRGLRPRKDIAHLVAELPYDVVDSKEARIIAQKNQYNFYHVLKPEVDLPEDIDPSDDIIYHKGKENLDGFIENDILRKDESPKLYLYSLILGEKIQTGLVCCVHIDDYINGIIKKHELVLEDKVRDRSRHIDIINAHTGPVFLFYREDGSTTSIFKRAMEIEPEYDFVSDDGIRHIFRAISDEEIIREFREIFQDKILYIADGHHRAASAVNIARKKNKENPDHQGDEDYNWFLSVIFPHNQLSIIAYNRVVTDLNELSKTEFLERLNEKFFFETTNNPVPEQKHMYCMYLDGKWYKLNPKFAIKDDVISSLDTNILQDTVLNPILGVKNPTEDKRIGFVGGINGYRDIEMMVNSNEYRVGFSLHPISVEELIEVSDINGLMPPKSTWFEPKLRSGLVIHLI